MPLPRAGYQLHFEELRPGKPELGSVSIVPWDTEIFGFPVAVYRMGASNLQTAARGEFVKQFSRWVDQNQVSLCACTIPVNEAHSLWRFYLSEAGFHFVDFNLQVVLNGLHNASLPKARIELRLAESRDHEEIEAIAAQSFQHGRYHADPLFPRQLADSRYRRWVRSALTKENPVDRVYVMDGPGWLRGFFHITLEEAVSDLRLAAVAPRLKRTALGFDLYLSVLHSLKKLGVRRVVTSISAGNTAVMNVYAKLGFSFSAPEMIFHWHRAETGT